MYHLRCVVERITYQNETNGFSVIKCRAKGYNDLVTVVGNMPDVHVGSVLAMEGQWRVDRKFGRQFSAEKWEETLPATTYRIEKYLGNGLIKGVGSKFAKRIVQKFGKDTLEVIETDPDSLIQVEGIGKKRAERLKKGWQEQREIIMRVFDYIKEPENLLTVELVQMIGSIHEHKGKQELFLEANMEGNEPCFS